MGQMLRITNTDTPSEQTWILHGQLAGPWVTELQLDWERARASCQGRKCVVDLTEVTFIDEGGESLIRRMRNQGAHFVVSGVENQHLLASLDNGKTKSFRKCLSHWTYGNIRPAKK